MASPDQIPWWVSLLWRVPTIYPAATMVVGAAIFAVGLYCWIWPAAEVSKPAKAETVSPPGPSFNFPGPSTNNFNFPAPAPKPPERDPDGIYQHGRMVGKVIAPRVLLNESKVLFEQIQNAGDLDTSKNIEYREHILRLVKADSFTGVMAGSGNVAHNVYKGVMSEIVGRTN